MSKKKPPRIIVKTGSSEVLDLEPPDIKLCQAETSRYVPFVMGGRTTEWIRCSNAPTVIATERKADEHGRKGSMSLCDGCRDVLKSKHPGKGFV